LRSIRRAIVSNALLWRLRRDLPARDQSFVKFDQAHRDLRFDRRFETFE